MAARKCVKKSSIGRERQNENGAEERTAIKNAINWRERDKGRCLGKSIVGIDNEMYQLETNSKIGRRTYGVVAECAYIRMYGV